MMQLELAPLYAKMGLKSSPSKRVQTWLNTLHAGTSSLHMVLDRDAAGDQPSSPPCAVCCCQSYRC